MSSAVLSFSKVSGPERVRLFLGELKEYLGTKTADGVLQGAPREIVETIVKESSHISPDCIANFTKQLVMAVNAPCWGHFGMRCERIGNSGLVRVEIA